MLLLKPLPSTKTAMTHPSHFQMGGVRKIYKMGHTCQGTDNGSASCRMLQRLPWGRSPPAVLDAFAMYRGARGGRSMAGTGSPVFQGARLRWGSLHPAPRSLWESVGADLFFKALNMAFLALPYLPVPTRAPFPAHPCSASRWRGPSVSVVSAGLQNRSPGCSS